MAEFKVFLHPFLLSVLIIERVGGMGGEMHMFSLPDLLEQALIISNQ